MSTDKRPERAQGFIVPIACELWPEESGEYDAGGAKLSDIECLSPIAGSPTPSASNTRTRMKLQAHGEQRGDIEVECNRQGLPALDGAGLVWRKSSDGVADTRGCDLPVVVKRFEPLLPAGAPTSPHLVVCEDGSTLFVWWRTGTGIVVQRRALDGSLSAASTVYADTSGVNLWPCLCPMPDGRVRLYHWLPTGGDWQVGTAYTDDYGASWTEGQPVLSSALSGAGLTAVYRLRAGYCNGTTLLLAHVQNDDTSGPIYRDVLVQWASDDGGGIFSHVATQDGTTEERSGAFHDIAIHDRQFFVARLRYDTSSTTVIASVNRLASAWMSIDTAGEVGNTSTLAAGQYVGLRDQPGGAGHDYRIADGDLALWADDDGALFLALRRCDTSAAGPPPGMQACLTLRSPDEGSTWLATGSSGVFANRGQVWYYDDAGSTYPYRFAFAAHRGRAIGISDAYLATGGLRNSLFAWYLGGWDSWPMPTNGGQLVPTRRVAYDYAQTALESPDAQGWAIATSGGGETHTTTNFREVVNTGVGEYVEYTRSGALFTPSEGAIAAAAVEVTSGSFRLKIYAYDAGSGTRYASEIVVSPTLISLYDINGGILIGSYAYSGGRVRVRLDQSGNDAEGKAFVGNDTLEDRLWSDIATALNLTNAGVYVVDTIMMRVDASSVVAIDEWPAVYGSYTGEHGINMKLREKMPRSVIPEGTYFGQGVSLSAETGPSEVGHKWTVPRSWQYPPDAMLPRVSPSPRNPTSTRPIAEMDAATTEVRYAFKIGATESFPMGKVFGFFVDDWNGGDLRFDLYYGGAFHNVAITDFIEILARQYSSGRPRQRAKPCPRGTPYRACRRARRDGIGRADFGFPSPMYSKRSRARGYGERHFVPVDASYRRLGRRTGKPRIRASMAEAYSRASESRSVSGRLSRLARAARRMHDGPVRVARTAARGSIRARHGRGGPGRFPRHAIQLRASPLGHDGHEPYDDP
jgi:hypothetical protein